MKVWDAVQGTTTCKENSTMNTRYTDAYLKAAHKATFHNEHKITRSSLCTCFYCGHCFDPREEPDLQWWDEQSTEGMTLVCPECGIDCVIGDASGYPVTDEAFITACSDDWFCGISRISASKTLRKNQGIIT